MEDFVLVVAMVEVVVVEDFSPGVSIIGMMADGAFVPVVPIVGLVDGGVFVPVVIVEMVIVSMVDQFAHQISAVFPVAQGAGYAIQDLLLIAVTVAIVSDGVEVTAVAASDVD